MYFNLKKILVYLKHKKRKQNNTQTIFIILCLDQKMNQHDEQRIADSSLNVSLGYD